VRLTAAQQTSEFTKTIDLKRAGALQFKAWLSMNAATTDKIKLYVDGSLTPVATVTRGMDWQSIAGINLAAGVHSLRFVFDRKETVATAVTLDEAFIDEINVRYEDTLEDFASHRHHTDLG